MRSGLLLAVVLAGTDGGVPLPITPQGFSDRLISGDLLTIRAPKCEVSAYVDGKTCAVWALDELRRVECGKPASVCGARVDCECKATNPAGKQVKTLIQPGLQHAPAGDFPDLPRQPEKSPYPHPRSAKP